MRLAPLAAVVLIVALPAGGRELFRSGEAFLEGTGSIRTILTGTKGTDGDAFEQALRTDPTCIPVATFPDCSAFDGVGDRDAWSSFTRLRLRLDARLNERFSAVAVGDFEGRIARREIFGAPIGDQFEPSRFLDLEWESERADAQWRILLYRGYLQYEGDQLEVTVGRQRIPWGVGRLWNPIDRFNAIDPLAIEQDQSQGVDAVKARWLFSGFTFLEGIYAAGRVGEDRAYAGRLSGVFKDVDYSLIAGVFEQAPTLGFDLASNLGDAAGRMEVVWTDPKRRVRPFGETEKEQLPSYWQVVVSADYNVDVGTGIYLLAEYLYNGNALGTGVGEAGALVDFFQEQDGPGPPPFDRLVAQGTTDLFGQSRVITLTEHLTGVQAGYDITPELRGDLLVIYDWQGQSWSVFPTALYSPTGWLELRLGFQFFAGPRRSEFGDADTLGFLQAEVFF